MVTNNTTLVFLMMFTWFTIDFVLHMPLVVEVVQFLAIIILIAVLVAAASVLVVMLVILVVQI